MQKCLQILLHLRLGVFLNLTEFSASKLVAPHPITIKDVLGVIFNDVKDLV